MYKRCVNLSYGVQDVGYSVAYKRVLTLCYGVQVVSNSVFGVHALGYSAVYRG